MEVSIYQYLIICPLVFLAGFIDSIAGGGGLVSLPAYMIAGLPPHYAIATNKMSACMGTAVATAKYASNGYIPVKYALCSIITAVLGSTLGARLALAVNPHIFKIIMLIIIPITGGYILLRKGVLESGIPLPDSKTILLCIAIAFIIGIYDGFYGPGTGTFLLIALTGIAHMDIKRANGTTKAINLTTNASALAVYLINGKVLFPLSIIAGLFSIAGNYIGARFFSKGGSKIVKPVMIVVLVVFFAKILWELLS